jgi:hypothetical protein
MSPDAELIEVRQGDWLAGEVRICFESASADQRKAISWPNRKNIGTKYDVYNIQHLSQAGAAFKHNGDIL